jgi:hypothetical protein
MGEFLKDISGQTIIEHLSTYGIITGCITGLENTELITAAHKCYVKRTAAPIHH